MSAKRPYSYRQRRGGRGQTAIIVALCAVVLLASTALGVDGARFYAEGVSLQKSVDAAALAAVAESGNNGVSAVQTVAADMVQRNLHASPQTTVTVSTTEVISPVDAVTVTVQEQGFPLMFAPVVGLKSATLTRSSSAQYNAPVPMGNPSDQLGAPNGDLTSAITTYVPFSGTPGAGTAQLEPQNMSLSINGPDQSTESGDPYSPLYVLSGQPVSNLPSSQLFQNPFRSEASPPFDGYDYEVTIPATSTGSTYIQVYDAETCAGNFYDSNRSKIYGLPYTDVSQQQQYPAALNSAYGPYPTYYRLYWLDQSTGQRTTVPGSNILASGAVAGLPADTYIAPTENCDSTFKNRWYTLAKVDASKGGSYIINVDTCLGFNSHDYYADYPPSGVRAQSSAGSNGLPNCEGSEVNNFALRAVTTDAAYSCADLNCQTLPPNDPNNQPQVSALGRESIMVSSTGSSSTLDSLIYLAKIKPLYAGKWLLIKLYDPGDTFGGSSMQIVRPDGSYAPFEWYTETLDQNGHPFNSALQSSESTSLITSYPVQGLGGTFTPVPSPTSTPTPLPTATDTPNAATQTAAASATAAAEATVAAGATATAAAASSSTAAATASAIAAQTATAAASLTSIAGSTSTAAAGKTATAAATQTAIAGQTATSIAGQTATVAAGKTAVAGQTATVIAQQSAVAGQTATTIAGKTATAAASQTFVAGQTATSVAGKTAVAGQTATAIAGQTATAVTALTAIAKQTSTAIARQTATVAAGKTAVAGQTATAIAGQTATVAAGETAVAGQTATAIAAQTATVAAGQTAVAGQTATAVTQKTTVAGQTATAIAGQTATAIADLTAVAGQTSTAIARQTATVAAGKTAVAGQTATSVAQTAVAATSTAAAAKTQTAIAVATQTSEAHQTATAAAANTVAAAQTATALAQPTNTPVPTSTPPDDGSSSIQPDSQQVLGWHSMYAAPQSAALPSNLPTATDTPTPTPGANPAVYTTPQATPPSTSPYCPSGDTSNQPPSNISPPGSAAVGQTMAEDNPFDPLHSTSCFSVNDYQAWPSYNAPPTPVGYPTVAPYTTYNLYPTPPYNYRPFNGRWVYIFTQIPSDYNATDGSGNYTYNPSTSPYNNPNPWWWYVQYHITNIPNGSTFTDRTTWEVMVIDTPPHLIH